jgi:hypothetical protein
MNSFVVAGITTAALLGAIALGDRIRRLLPEHHLSADTKDTVKLAAGLIGTMSALLLGLLVSSAKGAYDATRGQVIQMAAKTAFLDRVLANYGPDAHEARQRFHDTVKAGVLQLWPEAARGSTGLESDASAGALVFTAIESLAPKDDTQRALKAQAATLTMALGEIRMLLLAQSVSSISRPLLVMVICWLLVIFLSFSVLAPPNATARLALAAAALAVAGAVFLILEFDRPFTGLVQLSNQSMMQALSQFTK